MAVAAVIQKTIDSAKHKQEPDQKEVVGQGGKHEGSKKDKDFVHAYLIMGEDNVSSKDKNIKNLMYVTGHAKEFLEEWFLQDVLNL